MLHEFIGSGLDVPKFDEPSFALVKNACESLGSRKIKMPIPGTSNSLHKPHVGRAIHAVYADMSGAEIIGALGLASPFNNAVDWFEHVYVARNCASRLQTHMLKLDNAQLRLTRWGDAVGLSGAQIEDDDSLENSGAFRLDPHQKAQAERTFRVIWKKFEDC